MKKKHVALALAAAMAVTTVGGATVYASEEHGPSSEAAPAWENYDARIAEIRTETDLVKREALMHEAEDELMNTWAIIPLYYYNDVYMQKTDVENIYSNLFGFKYFGFAKTPDNTLSLQIASEPNKLDPALNSTVDGACLAILAFSGLYSYNADGELVPELADSYELTFHSVHPYTKSLISAIPIADPETSRKSKRIVLSGDVPSPVNPPSGCHFRTRCPYATELCAQQDPEWREISKGHYAACHHLDKIN